MFTFSNGLPGLHGLRQLGICTDTTDIIGMYGNTKVILAVVPAPWIFPFQRKFEFHIGLLCETSLPKGESDKLEDARHSRALRGISISWSHNGPANRSLGHYENSIKPSENFWKTFADSFYSSSLGERVIAAPNYLDEFRPLPRVYMLEEDSKYYS
ncbi:uncharacterized protein EAF01_002502 [Botrytis porri]|uniref:uncharacterized protein n=1 Tax=Botrytis porri TaxID=87229 RepID=UPI00190148B8|nr:uncharacterized protein EAF01_002502 [Botrytis porri]KAF7910994.1 hypothetical protein EAF01_002502 [Botrytis porri]